jgi:hypothetical protein
LKWLDCEYFCTLLIALKVNTFLEEPATSGDNYSVSAHRIPAERGVSVRGLHDYCVWSALHNNALDSHCGSAQRRTNLAAQWVQEPALSWSLLTCVFLFPNTHNTNSRRIEFGLVLLSGTSVVFNIEFIITIYRPNCIRGLLVDLNRLKEEFYVKMRTI